MNNRIYLYRHIYEDISSKITRGLLKQGDKLPSARVMAATMGVSVNTVNTAYSQLESEGYIEAVNRRGYYVSEFADYSESVSGFSPTASTPPKATNVSTHTSALVDFSPSGVDFESYPFRSMRQAFKSVFTEENSGILTIPHRQGELSLRRALCSYLTLSRGVDCTPERMIIGQSTSWLLLQLCRVIQESRGLSGADKTYMFALENPVYNRASQVLSSFGYRTVPIDATQDGVRAEDLYSLAPTAVYVTPSHQFPLGFSMTVGRRQSIIEWAQRSGGYIIEDDYDSELRYTSKPIPSMQGLDRSGRVVYMGTLSKSLSPSVRISYMVLPPTLMESYLSLPLSFPGSVLEQQMLATFIEEGHLRRHINRIRKIYRQKRELLERELRSNIPSLTIMGDSAGHHLLVKNSADMSETDLVQRAGDKGVLVYPISRYFSGDTPTAEYKNTVLLGYGALSEKEICQGVMLLKEAWAVTN